MDFNFCDPLPDECPCPVCTLVQKDPYQLTCCGKIFCKSCLDQLIKRKQSCPNCRGDFISGNKYFPDINTERKIMHLRIICQNEGCDWIGCLKDFKKTHTVSCPVRIVPCRYSSVGCERKMKRSDVQSHNKECMEEHLDKAVTKLESVTNTLKHVSNTMDSVLKRIEELEENAKEQEEQDEETDDDDDSDDDDSDDDRDRSDHEDNHNYDGYHRHGYRRHYRHHDKYHHFHGRY